MDFVFASNHQRVFIHFHSADIHPEQIYNKSSGAYKINTHTIPE